MKVSVLPLLTSATPLLPPMMTTKEKVAAYEVPLAACDEIKSNYGGC
jgi:hypothetical protein